MPVIVIILLIAGVCFVIYKKGIQYKAIGKTEWVCVEVRTETDTPTGSPRNQQLRGRDARMYRPYIRYQWEGQEYIAKSFAAYSQAGIFPGDRVEVLVNAENKELVKIVR